MDLLGEDDTWPDGMSDEELQYLRGRAYLEGLDVEREPDIGAELVMHAAQAGYEPAMTRLSMLFRQGEGVEKDVGASLRWEREVVERKMRRYEEAVASQDGPTDELVGDAYFGLWLYADDLLTLGNGAYTQAALDCYASMRTIAERELKGSMSEVGALSGGLGFWLRQIAICHNFEGDAHRSAGQYELAIAANEESIKQIMIARRTLGDIETYFAGSDDELMQVAVPLLKSMNEGTLHELLHDEAICCQRLGDLYALVGNIEQADQYRRRSLLLWKELRAARDEDGKEAKVTRDELVYNHRMGLDAMRQGDLATAEDYLSKAYEMAQALSYHEDVDAQFDLATLTANKSLLFGLQGKTRDAFAWAQRAVNLMERVLELDDSQPKHQFFAAVLQRLGDCQIGFGDSHGAIRSYCRAIDELYASPDGDGHFGSADKMTIGLCQRIIHAGVWYKAEDYELLLQTFRRGVAAGERISAVEHDPKILRDIAAIRENMGHILKEQGRIKEARQEFGSSFDCWRLFTMLDDKDPTIWFDFAQAHLRMAEIESLDGDYMTARKTLESALLILGKYLEMDASDRVKLAFSQACYSYGTLNMIIEGRDIGSFFACGWSLAR